MDLNQAIEAELAEWTGDYREIVLQFVEGVRGRVATQDSRTMKEFLLQVIKLADAHQEAITEGNDSEARASIRQLINLLFNSPHKLTSGER